MKQLIAVVVDRLVGLVLPMPASGILKSFDIWIKMRMESRFVFLKTTIVNRSRIKGDGSLSQQCTSRERKTWGSPQTLKPQQHMLAAKLNTIDWYRTQKYMDTDMENSVKPKNYMARTSNAH